MKLLKILLFTAALVACGAFPKALALSQQTPASPQTAAEIPDFDALKKYDIRLSGDNAAAMYVLPLVRLSVAEIFFRKADGGFVNYYQSDDSREWGLRTESFFRVNPAVVLYGRVEYSDFTGRNMGRSAFIDPYYNPFDIVDMADTTAGKKRLENYRLVGAVSARVADRLHIGGKIDYTAANYTKFVDLRHTNEYMDMTATAGAVYEVAEGVGIGANYIYRRSTEGVTFKVYGNTDRIYYSLLNFGSFIGRREGVGDVGYTSVGKNKPVFNEFHGGSVQLSLALTPALGFIGEFTYKSRAGYYGVRSPQTIAYTDHSADIFEYRAGLTLRGERVCHSLKFTAADEKLQNFENVYREQASVAGGSTDIIYFGRVRVLDRNMVNMRVEYEAQTEWQGFSPRWTFGAAGDYFFRSQLTSLYPYHRKQTVRSYAAAVSASRNFFSGRNGYRISAGLSYGSGSGGGVQDGVYVAPSEGSVPPISLDEVLMHESEYLTANRMGASLGLRYMRVLSKGVSGYASLEGSFTKASGLVQIKDDSHGTVSVTIGCLF